MSNFVDIFRITGITRQMSNKKFYFDQAVAQDCGLKEAVLYEYIRFWCEKNKKAGRSYNDGHHWTYGSANTLADQFPFFTPKQIWLGVRSLEKNGYIITGRFNKKNYDRTKWYRISDKKLVP